MNRALLHELLDLGARYAPEYRGALSNHLPMALVALDALGAGPDRLRDFFERGALRLVLQNRAGQPLPDWTVPLGRPAAFPDLLATFAAIAAGSGSAALLRRTLPRLCEGVGAAAFHGLIRTAYGIEAGHDGEIVAGLAYWASRHLPLDAAGGDRLNLADWIDLVADTPPPEVPGNALIFERMRAVGESTHWIRHAGRLAIDARTLESLADFAARRYLATRHFTVLHLVTSAHALRLVLPFIDDPAPALAAYARAYAAGAVASGIDLRRDGEPASDSESDEDWDALARHAVQSNDEHIVKLVHTCREESRIYGDGPRRAAAARALG